MAVAQSLSVVYCPNPLRPAGERQHKTVALQKGDTVQSIVERLGLHDTPLSVTLGGCRLSAVGRRATRVRDGDVLVLQQVAGVEAATVAAKLVMYAEVSYGTALAIGTVLAFAANTAIAMALSAVASSLTRPSGSSSQQSDNTPAVYGVEGGSNSSRPYEPLLLVLGEHRVFPDYASRPFAEFVLDPTTKTDVINNTPATEMRQHPPFSVTAGNPVAPWVQIATDDQYTYYGDNAARTYTSSEQGKVSQPHTFVVRRSASGTATVATYEDYLILTDAQQSFQWTPAIDNTTNVSGATASGCRYVKTGNLVQIMGTVTFTVIASGAIEFRLSPPTTVSFANESDVAGQFNDTWSVTGRVYALTGTSTIPSLRFNGQASSAGNKTVSFTATYYAPSEGG